MKKILKNRQSGFTLIEIAIVLVIIGLLLGGVLKGQEMINSAKVKNIATTSGRFPFIFMDIKIGLERYQAMTPEPLLIFPVLSLPLRQVFKATA